MGKLSRVDKLLLVLEALVDWLWPRPAGLVVEKFQAKTRNDHGFTRPELGMIVIILGILLGVAAPRLAKPKEDVVEAVVAEKEIGKAKEEIFRDLRNGYRPRQRSSSAVSMPVTIPASSPILIAETSIEKINRSFAEDDLPLTVDRTIAVHVVQKAD